MSSVKTWKWAALTAYIAAGAALPWPVMSSQPHKPT